MGSDTNIIEDFSMERTRKIFNRLHCKLCMSLQQIEDVRIVSNDLEIYFKGFEVALKRKQVEDAVGYLESMIDEIDYTSDRLQSQKNHRVDIENRKQNIKRMIADHQRLIEHLQGELRRL